jgi:hypothetical protein
MMEVREEEGRERKGIFVFWFLLCFPRVRVGSFFFFFLFSAQHFCLFDFRFLVLSSVDSNRLKSCKELRVRLKSTSIDSKRQSGKCMSVMDNSLYCISLTYP